MSRHWGSGEASSLRLARRIERSEVLGPGPRSVVVVQGCHLRCEGCIAEATHPLGGGFELSIEEALSRVLALEEISGITFSGGEPFLQAPALAALIDLLRVERPGVSTMSYSGYRREWLLEKGSPAQRSLLRRLDILVDGPYIRRLHAPLLWRGSANQRIHALSARHRGEIERAEDAPAGMEWSLDENLALEWLGVPPVPDFLARLGGPGDQPGASTAEGSP